jgi:glycosyltransferase involved in cell wall biosynthesis
VLRRGAHTVVAVSQDLRDHLASEGFPRESVQVIYNGISVGDRPGCGERQAIRAQLGAGDGTLVVGTIARLDPVKDLRSLILATHLLAERLDVRLVVIGDGPERGGLETLAGGSVRKGSVVFLGQRDDARQWLAGCDVYVNSSIGEGVSLTILEAMAAALPVVATQVGGTPEVVTHECGRLVPPGNPRALADAIASLAANAFLRRQLGDAGRRRVEDHFSIERMVNAYRDLYLGTA